MQQRDILDRMEPSIPPDARERALAVLRALDEQLKALFASIEEGSNSAVSFRMPEQS